jgi:hypothetical protein
MSLRRLVVACAFLVVGVGSVPAQAQYFRNNGISFLLGWKGLGDTVDGISREKIWNVSDQATIGAGYFTAVGYNLWLDLLQAEIGIGTERLVEGRPRAPMFSFSATSGVRYFFLEERFRPFVGAHLQYMQLIPSIETTQIPRNVLTNYSPFWVGARLGGGAEYYFADEFSVLLHLDATALVGLNAPPPGGLATYVLPQFSGGLAANIYF